MGWAIIRVGFFALVLAGLGLASGCAKEVDYLSPERLDRGMVFSLDGVGGYNWGPRWLRSGLDDAGLGYGVDIFSWGHGPIGMYVADLWDEAGNKKRATELVDLVIRYQTFYPGRPVHLIGHSGGGGMVVFALEQMPAKVQVESVFLLAPALDPEHNLAPALRHVRQNCYVTYSPGDLPLMGMGTSVFTTMDGKHRAGAGLVGFKLPKDLSAEDAGEYAKVLQAKWQGSMIKEGYLGGHMSWTTARFSRDYLAPLIMGKPPQKIFQPLIETQAYTPVAPKVSVRKGDRK